MSTVRFYIKEGVEVPSQYAENWQVKKEGFYQLYNVNFLLPEHSEILQIAEGLKDVTEKVTASIEGDWPGEMIRDLKLVDSRVFVGAEAKAVFAVKSERVNGSLNDGDTIHRSVSLDVAGPTLQSLIDLVAAVRNFQAVDETGLKLEKPKDRDYWHDELESKSQKLENLKDYLTLPFWKRLFKSVPEPLKSWLKPGHR